MSGRCTGCSSRNEGATRSPPRQRTALGSSAEAGGGVTIPEEEGGRTQGILAALQEIEEALANEAPADKELVRVTGAGLWGVEDFYVRLRRTSERHPVPVVVHVGHRPRRGHLERSLLVRRALSSGGGPLRARTRLPPAHGARARPAGCRASPTWRPTCQDPSKGVASRIGTTARVGVKGETWAPCWPCRSTRDARTTTATGRCRTTWTKC